MVIMTPHIVRSPMERARYLVEEGRKMDWVVPEVVRTHGASNMGAFLEPPGPYAPGASLTVPGLVPEMGPSLAAPPAEMSVAPTLPAPRLMPQPNPAPPAGQPLPTLPAPAPGQRPAGGPAAGGGVGAAPPTAAQAPRGMALSRSTDFFSGNSASPIIPAGATEAAGPQPPR
jgi:hypothetical protein